MASDRFMDVRTTERGAVFLWGLVTAAWDAEMANPEPSQLLLDLLFAARYNLETALVEGGLKLNGFTREWYRALLQHELDAYYASEHDPVRV